MPISFSISIYNYIIYLKKKSTVYRQFIFIKNDIIIYEIYKFYK